MPLSESTKRALKVALAEYGAGPEVATAMDANTLKTSYTAVHDTRNTNVTAGTAAAGKVLVVDDNKDLAGLRDLTARRLKRQSVQTIDMNDHSITLSLAGLTSDILYVDPGGNNEDLKLPPESDMTGALLLIVNTADADEDVVVTDEWGNDTIMTVDQNEIGLCCCDGTTWRGGVLRQT